LKPNEQTRNNENKTSRNLEIRKRAHKALIIWLFFFIATLSINPLIPVALGLNLHDWPYSNPKGLLLFSVDYAGFFLVLPLLLTKGWKTFKKPSFITPVVTSAVNG